MLLKTAMPFNLSSPEYLSHHRTRNNRVSPVSRASPAHMNSPLKSDVHHTVWLYVSTSDTLYSREIIGQNMKVIQEKIMTTSSFLLIDLHAFSNADVLNTCIISNLTFVFLVTQYIYNQNQVGCDVGMIT